MIRSLCHATRDEQRRQLPGDDLVPRPMETITHAITIAAPPRAVWPWLMQLGSGRAGWYAYDRIDNGGRPSARRIDPALQRVVPGDVLPWLPGATAGFVVRNVIPDRALILVAPLETAARDGVAIPPAAGSRLRTSWTLVLQPLADGRTRLLSRGRISPDWLSPEGAGTTAPGQPIFIERVYDLLAKLPKPFLLTIAGSGHYLMESRMLNGVKERAEHAWAGASMHPGFQPSSVPDLPPQI